MGYTHYWTDEGQGKIPADAVARIRRVTEEAYLQGLIQREDDDPRPPLVTANEVRFNGVGDEGHDAFRFAPGDDAFCFCKTARKPYDAVVMRVLLILAYYRPGLEIRSDGAFHDEWQPALDWFDETQTGRVCVVERISFYRPTENGRFVFDHDA